MDPTTEPSPELVEEFVIAAHGDLDKVRAMHAQHPALLNIPWAKFDETALQAASHMGRRAIAEYLLAAGAPLNICAAAMLGQVAQVAAFLAADPQLANAHGAHGISIMFHAALSGEPAVAELLLAHGGGERMDSALHGAIMYGHTAMVAWMLDHGVRNLDEPNFEGKTPLRAAQDQGHTAIADLLRARGATEGAIPAQTAS
jgi:uncharacterized protein